LQDIELAANSQRVSGRQYNLIAVDEGGRCPSWVSSVGFGLFEGCPVYPRKRRKSRHSLDFASVPQAAV